MLRFTLLGTGTSQGIPVIGCDCAVCMSDSPEDKRLRAALLVQSTTTNIVIDVGPDFRQQMLSTQIAKLDAVLLTHEHNDHVIGLDDLRPFNFRQKINMPIYTSERVLTDLKSRFAYTFAEKIYPGVATFDWYLIDKNSHFTIQDIDIQCIEIMHGALPILGFRFGNVAYCTDVKSFSETELAKLKGLDTLVISALHHEKHHSHLTLTEALDYIEQLQPRRAILTHMSHQMGLSQAINNILPAHVLLGYDGMEF